MITQEEAKTKFDKTIGVLKEDLKQLRAGRPTPDMFENISVEAYGSQTNLASLANINIVDATLVTVQPWDKNVVDDVVAALQSPDYGYNPQVEGTLIRIPIPTMTKEKREESIKKVGELAEKAKIAVRMTRKEAMDFLDMQKEEGEFSEDQHTAAVKQLQKEVDAKNEQIETLASEKEEVLRKV